MIRVVCRVYLRVFARDELRVRAETKHNIAARLLIFLQLQKSLLLGLFEQVAEIAIAVEGLGEMRTLALKRLLDQRGPDVGVALAKQRLDLGQDDLDGVLFGAALGGRRLLGVLAVAGIGGVARRGRSRCRAGGGRRRGRVLARAARAARFAATRGFRR